MNILPELSWTCLSETLGKIVSAARIDRKRLTADQVLEAMIGG